MHPSRRALAAVALAAATASCARSHGPPVVKDDPTGGGPPARLGAATAGDLRVTDAQVLPRLGRGAAIVLRITNSSRATAGDDALVGVTTNLGAATLVPSRVPVPAGGTVSLTATGAGPAATLPADAPLVAKETAALTLDFAHAGNVSVFATVG